MEQKGGKGDEEVKEAKERAKDEEEAKKDEGEGDQVAKENDGEQELKQGQEVPEGTLIEDEPVTDSKLKALLAELLARDRLDDYIPRLALILSQLHASFFKRLLPSSKPLQSSRKPPARPSQDVRELLRSAQSCVLSGLKIAFSGVIPHSFPLLSSREGRLASLLGAQCWYPQLPPPSCS